VNVGIYMNILDGIGCTEIYILTADSYVMLCSLVPAWADFCRTTWHHFLEELVVWRILEN
jgi:hypothetical protein